MTTLNTTIRNTTLQAIVTQSGANAKLKFYNGSKTANLGAPSGTLLATLIAGASLGVVSNGTMTIDAPAFTQTEADHVAGTPTYVRIESAGGTVVGDFDIGAGAGKFQLSGNTAPNVVINASGLSLVAGNA